MTASCAGAKLRGLRRPVPETMSDTGETLIVLCTCPDADTGTRLADELVSRRLAACVNRVPGVVSTYVWKGAVNHDDEVLLIIKTTSLAYRKLESTLRDLHPYELPEILAVPVSKGLPDYLAWVYASTAPKT